ncbi:phage tail-collar fiber domain-containing protein [Pseudomonas sp. S2_E01]
MVNQNSIFGGMLTTQGAAKKTNCDALGIPWEPRYMLIGDANGADPVPSPTQTKLVNQVYRAQLNQLRVSPTDANILIAELVLPPDVGGWWIRELALEDKDGVFCAVANAAPSYKPLLAQGSGRNQVVRMHIITSGTSNIQLKIDPSVVLATRQYVDETINGLLPANKPAGTYTKVTVNDRGVFVSGSNPTTLAGFGITDTYTKPEIDAIIAQASALPVGSMVAFPVYKIPPGFLEINGGEWPIANYPDLAAFLGTAFNKGTEAAGYFRLPESRGEFLRGWDNGRGVDAGRAVGSYQADEVKSHSHNSPYIEAPLGSGTGQVEGVSKLNDVMGSTANSASATSSYGGTETRPRNLAVMWCIKAWNAPINQGNIDIAALAAQVAIATPVNYLEGFTLSNNVTVPTYAINVSRGAARASGNPVFLNSTMVCFVNTGAWTAGTNGQKLDIGARAANTWYNVFAIRATVGGAADVLVSLSYSAPKLPAGYELIRRIGSFKTDALNTIIPFQQFDRMFYWKTPIRDVVLTNVTGVAMANYAISVPPGAPVVAHVSAFYSGSNGYIYLRNPDFPDLAVGPYTAFTYGFGSVSSNTPLDSSSIPMEVLTSIDAQVGVRTVTGETQTEVVITTYGWQEKF